MPVGPAPRARPAPVAGRPFTLRGFIEREGVFSWLMLIPGVLFLLAFVAYPFFYGIYLRLRGGRGAEPGTFVGLATFVALFQDAVFWQVTRNTFVYTIVTTFFKMIGGLAMALVMNQRFHGRNLARAFLLLPFIVPTILSTVAWMWILDPTFSVVNWTLLNTGVISNNFSWLGNKHLAMVSIIAVNVWRGVPFYGITLLAGLQTISPALAGAVLKPVLITVTMFSVIFPFSDFQLVYALTHGGPANATHLFATYAFDVGMSAGQLGSGAAVALSMLPALALLIVGLTLYLRREWCRAPSHGRGANPRGADTEDLPPADRLPGRDAVPVLLDGDHVHQAEPGAVQRKDHAADGASAHAEALLRPPHRNQLPHVDLQHHAGRGGHHRGVAGDRHDDGLSPGPAPVPRRRSHGHRGGGDLPRPAAGALHSHGRR